MMKGNEGQYFAKKKILGHLGLFPNTPKCSVTLTGRQKPPQQLLPAFHPLPCSHPLFPTQIGITLCLCSNHHRSSTQALCHLKHFAGCFACVSQLWSYTNKQFKLEHLLLRNASKIITCPTATLYREVIS